MSSTQRTEFASHELDEAVTDPLPQTARAYIGFDKDHLSYAFFNAFQDEVGDACEIFQSSFYVTAETGFAYGVQRQWSNKSAAGGHNPCVPVLGEPFYNTTPFPSQQDAISVDLTSAGGTATSSMGFKAALNQPRTFQLGLYSDAATSGAWTLSAVVDTNMPFPDRKGKAIANGQATVTFDSTTGLNGDVVSVTVTPTDFGPLGVVYLYVKSALPGALANHYMPIIVSQN